MKKMCFCLFLMFITAHSVKAVQVKCFYPLKNWQISIDITGFEPDYSSIGGMALLSGDAGGMQITILAADTNSRNAAQDRERYGLKRANSAGDVNTIKLFDVNDFRCLKYKWKKDASNNSFNNTWGYFAYYVKDGTAVNLLLTADITEHREKEFIDIIKSLKIKPTKELKDLNKILDIMEARLADVNDKEKELTKRIEKGKEYLEKHPDCQEVLYRLGDYCTGQGQLQAARDYYLKALQSSKTTMPTSPQTIWIVYEGLGEDYALAKKYEASIQYFKAAYDLAKKADVRKSLSLSAYNLACCYAETNDIDNCLKYITESLEIDPNNIKDIKTDSSFGKFMQDEKFKKIITKYEKK